MDKTRGSREPGCGVCADTHALKDTDRSPSYYTDLMAVVTAAGPAP